MRRRNSSSLFSTLFVIFAAFVVAWLTISLVAARRSRHRRAHTAADATDALWEQQQWADDAAAIDPSAPDDADAARYNLSWPRRIVFSINTARAGSRFLANLLGSAAEDVWAFHEPFPCHVLRDPGVWNASYARRRREAVPFLWRSLERMPRGATFALTCANFKAQLHDVFMDALLGAPGSDTTTIYVVVLRRYLPAVVKSLADIGWAADPNPLSCLWCRTANWPNWRTVLGERGAPESDSSMTQLERLVSYAVATEGFASWFAGRYANHPRVRIVEARTEEILTSKGAALALLEKLGMQPSAENTDLAIRSAMLSDRVCKVSKSVATLKEAEKAARRYISRCRRLGKEQCFIPDSLEEKTMTRTRGFDYSSTRCSPSHEEAEKAALETRRFVRDAMAI